MVNVQYIVSFKDNDLLNDIFDYRDEAIDWAKSHIDYRPTVEAAEVEYGDYGTYNIGEKETIFSYEDVAEVDESCKKALKEDDVASALAKFEAELKDETNEALTPAKFDFDKDEVVEPENHETQEAKFDFEKDEDSYKDIVKEDVDEDNSDDNSDDEDEEPHVVRVPDTDFLVNDVEIDDKKDDSEDKVEVKAEPEFDDTPIVGVFETEFDVKPLDFKDRDTAEDYLADPVDFLQELADALGIGDQVEIKAAESDEIPEVSDDDEDTKIVDKEVSSELVKDFDTEEDSDAEDKEDDKKDDSEDKDDDVEDKADEIEKVSDEDKKSEEEKAEDDKKELDEYYEPCCAIKDETELKGMDNAVVDCQTDYKIIAHSEDEKPLDCKMKKAPLEKPLTEDDMSEEDFLEAFGKAMVERHNCKK